MLLWERDTDLGLPGCFLVSCFSPCGVWLCTSACGAYNHFQNYNRLVYHTHSSIHFLIVADSRLNPLFWHHFISFPSIFLGNEAGWLSLRKVLVLLQMCEHRNHKNSWNGCFQKGWAEQGESVWFAGWIKPFPHPQWMQLVTKLRGLFSFNLPVFVVQLLFFCQSEKGQGIQNDGVVCQCWSNPIKTISSQKVPASWRTELSSPICKRTCSLLQDTFPTFPFKAVLEEWQVVFLTRQFKENLL